MGKIRMVRPAVKQESPKAMPRTVLEQNRRERQIKADILLEIGKRPDVMLLPIATGVFKPMDGSARTIRSAPTGTADILCVHRRVIVQKRVINEGGFQPLERLDPLTFGQAIAIEVKTRTGRQREAQQNFEEAWRAHGGLYILARSVEDVLRGLQYN